MNFPVELYGLPKAESYSYNTDLVLLATAQASGYTRQRRTHMHNASLFTLTFKVSTTQSAALRTWLQDNNDWFSVPLLSGNDASQACGLHPVDVRRTSTINATRVSSLDQFLISFEAETRSMAGYQVLANAAAGLVVQEYPSTLPVPTMNGFTASHDYRNVTTYNLVYRMNTATLKRWQAFAGYVGTAWFRTFMVSPNAYGTHEVLRYTSSPSMALVRPDVWEITIAAQTLPFMLVNGVDSLLPPGECTYDSPTTYDEPTELYDCGGSVTPPTGNFVTPSGVFNINASASGLAPQTSQAFIALRANGTVDSNPVGSPPWTQWHTNINALPDPAVAFDSAVELSTDGINWVNYVPSPQGNYISLRSNVYVRRVITSSVNLSESKLVNMTFQSDRQTDQLSTQSVAMRFNSTITIVNAPSTIVPNFHIRDVVRVEVGIDAPIQPWRIGVVIRPDGSSSSVNSAVSDGDWALPHAPNTGAGRWLLATKTSGQDVVPNQGVRVSMATNITYDVNATTGDDRVVWVGTLQIYDAQTGGNLLGTGTMELDGLVTEREPDEPPGRPPEIPVEPV